MKGKKPFTVQSGTTETRGGFGGDMIIFYIVAVIIFLSLISCSASWHLKQAIKKGAQVTVDTVYQEVIVKIPEVRIDTLVKVVDFSDTITVVKDSVITKLKINTVEKTAYIATKCPEKVKIVKVPYQVRTEIKAPPSKIKWWHLVIVGMGCFVLGGIVTKLARFIA